MPQVAENLNGGRRAGDSFYTGQELSDGAKPRNRQRVVEHMRAITDRSVTTYAIVGADYQGLRPAPKVAVGDTVRAGQVLLTDRTHPRVAIVAPMAGKVASIDYGPRRTLSALVIDGATSVNAPPPVEKREKMTRESLRGTLLAQGLWPALRTRPFGRFPDPDRVPNAIFVTATDSEPLAPDPRAYLASREQAFRAGVALLALLTDGPVYVCQSAGAALVEETPRIRNVVFDGAHPAGLASAQIETLYPVGLGQEVWTIDCQDTAAVGQLIETGYFDPARIVAVTNAQTQQSELIRTIPGASLRELAGSTDQMMSGSQLAGRKANWLGRFHRQITTGVADAHPSGSARARPLFSALMKPGGQQRNLPHAIIPTSALERTLPPHILPVPLMRALSIGDTETAARLGALSLIEEDMALLTSRCTSGADYGSLLRHALDDLEGEA
ncbi:NADH:ubiquinone reductase (Na(+)-transporting) subunit A [uncultured Sulfitobacter sp.]|uniref:NADH:ubiquinone reductase (Na(+)-transporting) subunit A n=1 Tax=uncultured Sulfitobacter sp. TaxID=191468 RepID=UPI002613447B|nr:NADH:ubiquinone reductase (Na(+)-transporting) subunit A [uncultured Sulfitobacter sp.]